MGFYSGGSPGEVFYGAFGDDGDGRAFCLKKSAIVSLARVLQPKR
jgi:hypothetical protein